MLGVDQFTQPRLVNIGRSYPNSMIGHRLATPATEPHGATACHREMPEWSGTDTMSITCSLMDSTIAPAIGAEQCERSNRRLSHRLSFDAKHVPVHFRIARRGDGPGGAT